VSAVAIADSTPEPNPDAPLPEIDLDQASKRRPARVPLARPRDIILPRTVVAAWALFVLVAQALGFVAGLLAGHFLWQVH
jgi:hypothetical protein